MAVKAGQLSTTASAGGSAAEPAAPPLRAVGSDTPASAEPHGHVPVAVLTAVAKRSTVTDLSVPSVLDTVIKQPDGSGSTAECGRSGLGTAIAAGTVLLMLLCVMRN